MSLLPAMVLYLAVGCSEWYLALRRTLACARGEKVVLVSIVFIENLLGLWVLSNFVRTNNWFLALSYALGGAAGALIVAVYNPEKPGQTIGPSARRTPRHTKTRIRRRSLLSEVSERLASSRAAWRWLARRQTKTISKTVGMGCHVDTNA
jgi:hypothetical protein